jgi:outer membrane protein assembly factor BamB
MKLSKIREVLECGVSAPLWYLALALVCGSIRAEDWPRFLGPRADGTSSETNLIDSFPEGGPKIVWEAVIGTGYSAPSVRTMPNGERLLVLHHRYTSKREEIIEGFDANTGKRLWKHVYPSDFVDPYGYNNGPRCTPLLTDKHCYTFGAEGKLTCLELATQKVVWQRDAGKDWEIPQAFFGVGSTPILEGDNLIVMVGGQTNSGVVALDPLTGKTKWESVGARNWTGVPMTGWRGERSVVWNPYEKQASYATPVAATVNGARQIFCLMRQGLVSLNPTNGAVNFSFWFRSEANDSVNASCPIVVGNKVLISGAYYKVGSVLLEIAPDNKSVKEAWRGLGLEMHFSTPSLVDGYLYAFSGRDEPDALFRCVEYKTGKVMWERNERGPKHAPEWKTFGRASTILADGKLYALGEWGLLGIFKPNPAECQELGRWQIPGLRYPCWGAPVLSEKKLYLRSEDRLLCIDLAKK